MCKVKEKAELVQMLALNCGWSSILALLKGDLINCAVKLPLEREHQPRDYEIPYFNHMSRDQSGCGTNIDGKYEHLMLTIFSKA
jgi:hypothetical protein